MQYPVVFRVSIVVIASSVIFFWANPTYGVWPYTMMCNKPVSEFQCSRSVLVNLWMSGILSSSGVLDNQIYYVIHIHLISDVTHEISVSSPPSFYPLFRFGVIYWMQGTNRAFMDTLTYITVKFSCSLLSRSCSQFFSTSDVIVTSPCDTTCITLLFFIMWLSFLPSLLSITKYFPLQPLTSVLVYGKLHSLIFRRTL